MSKEQLKRKAANLTEKYSENISIENLVLELTYMTMLHDGNFGRKQLGALELLNVLAEYRL